MGERIANLAGYLNGESVIITDSNVKAALEDRFPDLPNIVVEPGESSKDMSKVQAVYEQLLEINLSRSGMLVGIGGGVVTDITGFVGATYKRGIRFGFVPTSLLAMVDAALGGKNGVNFGGYKNQVGTIVQPEFVLIDPTTLDTLPEEEFRNGMAEVIKTAAIGDPELFLILEHEARRIEAKEPEMLNDVISRCVMVKAGVVNKDDRESGIRAVLNYGHTIGHALESVTGMSHGEGVALGMVLEAKAAGELGLMPENEVERLINVLKAFGLPTTQEVEPSQLSNAIDKDKKAFGDSIKFPVVGTIGCGELIELKIEDLKGIINDLC